jgi:hypothetical protein
MRRTSDERSFPISIEPAYCAPVLAARRSSPRDTMGAFRRSRYATRFGHRVARRSGTLAQQSGSTRYRVRPPLAQSSITRIPSVRNTASYDIQIEASEVSTRNLLGITSITVPKQRSSTSQTRMFGRITGTYGLRVRSIRALLPGWAGSELLGIKSKLPSTGP